MGLRVKRSSKLGLHLILTLTAAFALIAQPMYGVVTSYIASAAGETIVQPSSMNGWVQNGRNISFSDTQAKIGNGSIQFSTIGETQKTGGQKHVRTNIYADTKLSAITELGYSSFVEERTTGESVAPLIRLDVRLLDTDTQLIWEPAYGAGIIKGAWQDYNPLTQGRWNVTKATGTGTIFPNQETWVSWDAIINADSNAYIRSVTSGSVSLSAGQNNNTQSPWAGFVGYVDDFRFNNTSYNFEPLALLPPNAPTSLHRVNSDGKIVNCNDITRRQVQTPTWTRSSSSDVAYYEYSSFNKNGVNGIVERNIGDINHFNVNGWTPPEDGTGYAFAVRAVGTNGLKSKWASCGVTYDSTTPVARITSPSENGQVLRGNITVTGEVDPSEQNIQSHWFEIKSPDGSLSYIHNLNATTLNHSFTLDTAKGDGVYTIRYVASDKAGNRSDDPNYTNTTTRTILVDNTAPVITSNANDVVSGTYTFQVSQQAEKNPRRIYVQYDQRVGSTWKKVANTGWKNDVNSAALTVDTTQWPDGIYQLKVSSDDKAGNHGAYAKTMYVNNRTKGVLADPFLRFSTLYSTSFGFSDHSVQYGQYSDQNALWHGTENTNWYLVYESTSGWTTTNGQVPGKAVVAIRTFTSGQPLPALSAADLGITPGSTQTFWVHLVPVSNSFRPVVGENYPADSAYTRAWASATLSMPATTPSTEQPTGTITELVQQAGVISPLTGLATSNSSTTNPSIPSQSETASMSVADNGEVAGVSDTNTRNSTADDEEKGEVLAAQDSKKSWSVVNLALSIVTVLVGLVSLAGAFTKRKEHENKHTAVRVLTLVPTIGVVVAFFFLENLSLPLGWFNTWTILFGAVLIIQLILASLGKSAQTNE